jgi:RHS repeat-associated protein
MRMPVNKKCSCDAMNYHGIQGVFFCTFSPNTAAIPFQLFNSVQGSSHDSLCLTFTGKEKDEETGYGYFGARYMDHELMTMWLSVDPMADKYPSISPYAYCAWNPVKLVDPDGREVYITGDAADKATKQLSSRGITVTRDNETGRLSCTLTGKKLSKEDKVLIEAINSKNVVVNVNATTSSTVEFEGESLGNSRYTGQFLGVSVTDCENRIATASQLVNPDVCARRDGEYKVPIGISMRHEVTEAFRAGEICLGEGASYGPCWRDWKGYKLNVPEDHVYFKAHNRATPQAIDAAPIIQERREEANFKMANIIFGMSRDQWNRLDPIFRPHLP